MKKGISMLLVIALLLPCFAFASEGKSRSEADCAAVLQSAGIIHGTEIGLELARTITRAEAVTMLYRITMQESTEYSYRDCFADVPKNHWACEWIERPMRINMFSEQ